MSIIIACDRARTDRDTTVDYQLLVVIDIHICLRTRKKCRTLPLVIIILSLGVRLSFMRAVAAGR